MELDIFDFYQATNPGHKLDIKNPDDAKYYIDFATVRGGAIINQLKFKIVASAENKFVCQLFSGHLGCGKSTELLRLKKELEDADFKVIYFESSDDLDMGDVKISDILLAIARRVSESLEAEQQKQQAAGFGSFLEKAKQLLMTEIDLSVEGKIPGVGDFAVNTSDRSLSLSTLIGKITATTRKDRDVRDRLRARLEPKTDGIIDTINEGLLEPAIATLKTLGKKGLVVIVDNLDRLHNIVTAANQLQTVYLFADRGDQLNRLHCHVFYTMPLALRYSNDYKRVRERLDDPIILPMVPTLFRSGNPHLEGIEMLKQMILARALPEILDPQIRNTYVERIFDHPDSLDRLCQVSGGHVRNLLRLLNNWITQEQQFPLTRQRLEDVIVTQLNEDKQGITSKEWELLRRVREEKSLAGDRDYEKLIRTLLVYEYRDHEGSWYDINPVLAQAIQFK